MMKLYFYFVIIGVCRKCRSDMVHAILVKDNPIESLHAPVNTYSEHTTITTVSEEVGTLLQ